MAKPKNNGSSSKNNSITLKESKDITGATSAPGDSEQRKMVAESAYFRALGRNLEGGDPVEDWLEAEKEIGTRLNVD